MTPSRRSFLGLLGGATALLALPRLPVPRALTIVARPPLLTPSTFYYMSDDFPPFHANCRCVIYPIIDDIVELAP